MTQTVEELTAEVERLKGALRLMARCDRSKPYEHHEPRHFDNRLPRDAGGTVWLTPREIARNFLREPNLATFAEARGPLLMTEPGP